MLKTFKEIVKEHIKYRRQLIKLAKSDLDKQYKGSVLGIAWAIIRPAIVIFVFWFGFTFGLRKGRDIDGYPFFLWLITGMIPWFYMRDMVSGGAGCIRKYKYLVTKIKYPVSTIPTIISLSNMATHLGLILIMILIFMSFGYMPTWHILQLPIYTLMMFMFFQTWGIFSGMVSAVSRDFLNLVRALTQALFWMSGIIYNAEGINTIWIRRLLMFNPVTIIATGYRNVFIKHVWIWESPRALRNFVIVYTIMLILALRAYGKLKKDIPDML